MSSINFTWSTLEYFVLYVFKDSHGKWRNMPTIEKYFSLIFPHVLSSSHFSLVFHEFHWHCFFKKAFFRCYKFLQRWLNPTIGFELARTHHCVELQVSCSFTLTDYGFFYNITLTKVYFFVISKFDSIKIKRKSRILSKKKG